MRDPLDVLAEGSAVLAPALTPLGYSWAGTSQGTGSGGPFASGQWISGERSIETHVRHALGIVEYAWGDLRISHQDFLRVRDLKGSYPGFSDDPVQGFRHLAADLTGPVRPLLVCDHDAFSAVVAAADAMPRRSLP